MFWYIWIVLVETNLSVCDPVSCHVLVIETEEWFFLLDIWLACLLVWWCLKVCTRRFKSFLSNTFFNLFMFWWWIRFVALLHYKEVVQKRERERKKKFNRKALNKVNWLPNFVNYIANTKNLVKKKINKHKLNKLIWR